MPLQLSDLAGLDSPVPAVSGAPLSLAIDLIDEDPDQPRTEFDDESLQELAATIRERGVRQPVSVRQHPHKPGHWMLNFGARRLRASKLVGQRNIPAFIDESADTYDQVIENEQRQGLKPIELALFVSRRLTAGESQADIARRLGKSRAFVTYVCAMIDPPDWLAAAYREGRCRGVRELYDIRRLHEKHGESVVEWLAEQKLVSRRDIELLSDRFDVRRGVAEGAAPASSQANPIAVGPVAALVRHSVPPASVLARQPEPDLEGQAAKRPLMLRAMFDGQLVEALLWPVPDEAGHVYVVGHAMERRQAVPIGALSSLSLVAT